MRKKLLAIKELKDFINRMDFIKDLINRTIKALLLLDY